MAIPGAQLGWRLPCLKVLRVGRSPITWRSYTASTGASVDVKSESESGTEKLAEYSMHRKRSNLPWTPEETRLAYELADAGINHHGIVARLPGRPCSSVEKVIYLRRSGAPVAQGSRKWNSQETRELLSLVRSGASVREIRKNFPLRSVPSIDCKRRNLKTQDNPGQAKLPTHYWTADETARLHRLAQDGFSKS
jgi:hypothetical protein